jgi:DNA-binding protein YbaB
MKASFVCALLSLASVQAFAPAPLRPSTVIVTQRNMFSGSGTGAAEDDTEAMVQVEQAAKAMGMTVEEYQLGMNARMRLENDLSSQRLTGGSGGITVERDAKNPPTFMEITITEEGKAKGKEAVQKHVVEAMKKANEAAKKGRTEAQKSMMAFITEQLK